MVLYPRWFCLDIFVHLAPKRTRYAWKEGDFYGAQENAFWTYPDFVDSFLTGFQSQVDARDNPYSG